MLDHTQQRYSENQAQPAQGNALVFEQYQCPVISAKWECLPAYAPVGTLPSRCSKPEGPGSDAIEKLELCYCHACRA